VKDEMNGGRLARSPLICLIILMATANFAQPQQNSQTASDKTSQPVFEVAATIETEPMTTSGDSADDTTLWVNPSNPSLSLIIGTNKQRGLVVYDLTGKQVQFLPDGRMNNVDHRDNFPFGNKRISLITSSNRSNNSIAIYRVNPETRRLENVAARRMITIEAYGACMYHSQKTDKFYYIVTSKQGLVEQFELFDNGKGKVDGRRVRRFKVGAQLEGCVADDELGNLYIGEELVGIWKYPAEPETNPVRNKVDGVVPEGHLVADIEGLTIAYGKDGKGYLIASSQGNNSYSVYRREGSNAFIKLFRIVAGNGIDEVTETDGIYVTTTNLGAMFPKGVFIAQDGLDDKGKQNFKLVPWQLITEEQ
jgi:3-phytase